MKPEFSRVFIKDDLSDILVLKDRKRKGIWNIPGGKQEINETPVDCAIRELREELALEISGSLDNIIFNFSDHFIEILRFLKFGRMSDQSNMVF